MEVSITKKVSRVVDKYFLYHDSFFERGRKIGEAMESLHISRRAFIIKQIREAQSRHVRNVGSQSNLSLQLMKIEHYRINPDYYEDPRTRRKYVPKSYGDAMVAFLASIPIHHRIRALNEIYMIAFNIAGEEFSKLIDDEDKIDDSIIETEDSSCIIPNDPKNRRNYLPKSSWDGEVVWSDPIDHMGQEPHDIRMMSPDFYYEPKNMRNLVPESYGNAMVASGSIQRIETFQRIYTMGINKIGEKSSNLITNKDEIDSIFETKDTPCITSHYIYIKKFYS